MTKQMTSKAVAVISGGLDSTVLLYDTLNSNTLDVVQAVSFNYGQRHKKELDYASATCEKLHISWTLIDLWSSGLTEALSDSKSSLISKTDVPEGHYAEENMKATVVPNRNMIMLSIAGGIAVAKDADTILTGVHAGDHFVYPDCRPRFIEAASAAIKLGNAGFGAFPEVEDDSYLIDTGGIVAPFMFQSKADIAEIGIKLGVPLDETWSCYNGKEIHCGRCGTCVERLEAIDEACARLNLDPVKVDKTKYADTEFWKQAVANA